MVVLVVVVEVFAVVVVSFLFFSWPWWWRFDVAAHLALLNVEERYFVGSSCYCAWLCDLMAMGWWGLVLLCCFIQYHCGRVCVPLEKDYRVHTNVSGKLPACCIYHDAGIIYRRLLFNIIVVQSMFLRKRATEFTQMYRESCRHVASTMMQALYLK